MALDVDVHLLADLWRVSVIYRQRKKKEHDRVHHTNPLPILAVHLETLDLRSAELTTSANTDAISVLPSCAGIEA